MPTELTAAASHGHGQLGLLLSVDVDNLSGGINYLPADNALIMVVSAARYISLSCTHVCGQAVLAREEGDSSLQKISSYTNKTFSPKNC